MLWRYSQFFYCNSYLQTYQFNIGIHQESRQLETYFIKRTSKVTNSSPRNTAYPAKTFTSFSGFIILSKLPAPTETTPMDLLSFCILPHNQTKGITKSITSFSGLHPHANLPVWFTENQNYKPPVLQKRGIVPFSSQLPFPKMDLTGKPSWKLTTNGITHLIDWHPLFHPTLRNAGGTVMQSVTYSTYGGTFLL